MPAITFSLEKDQLEERFKKLSNELRCPTCQGLAVKDSEAGFSTSIKGKIRELIEKGNSDEEILHILLKDMDSGYCVHLRYQVSIWFYGYCLVLL